MSLIPEHFYETFKRNADLLSEKYSQEDPFPHAVLDNFFDPNQLLEIANLFPSPNQGHWWRYDNVLERKLARNDVHNFPVKLQHFIYELQSHRFVSFLETLTGISGLITDHTLNGGGLHCILGSGAKGQGGKLDIHADYNYHPITGLDRRLNVLIYLNNGWMESWKGNLELWDKDMTRCVKSIQPLFNRMVIFNVTDDSLHGHPDPLECPENRSRNSIALYYYSHGRPEKEKTDAHSTLFRKRPQDPDSAEDEQLRIKRAIRRLST